MELKNGCRCRLYRPFRRGSEVAFRSQPITRTVAAGERRRAGGGAGGRGVVREGRDGVVVAEGMGRRKEQLRNGTR
ncbi:hypothetical protein E2C01_099731 [Portunus trituberculatus]|uniref:Uncharacterized protein n=1 Tax=Portunus trituberculatus TaxID=210409 RepID=A0A5B7K124_PORTR|nr:hypothetical protein [Portunus trituberculatus]